MTYPPGTRSGGIRAHRSDLEQARKSDSTHVGSLAEIAEIAEIEEISKMGANHPKGGEKSGHWFLVARRSRIAAIPYRPRDIRASRPFRLSTEYLVGCAPLPSGRNLGPIRLGYRNSRVLQFVFSKLEESAIV